MNFELAKQRRSAAPHRSMFLRMLIRAAVLRRGRAAAALLAMVVAAGVTTAILNLYVDTQTKLREQFRNYGANIVVVAREGQTFSPDALRIVNSTIADGSLAVPFGYVVARTPDQLVVGNGMAADGRRSKGRACGHPCSEGRDAGGKGIRSQFPGAHNPSRSRWYVEDRRCGR